MMDTNTNVMVTFTAEGYQQETMLIPPSDFATYDTLATALLIHMEESDNDNITHITDNVSLLRNDILGNDERVTVYFRTQTPIVTGKHEIGRIQ